MRFFMGKADTYSSTDTGLRYSAGESIWRNALQTLTGTWGCSHPREGLLMQRRESAVPERSERAQVTSDTTPPITTRRGFWRRVDPLVYAVGAVSFVVYVTSGFDGILTRDLGIYSYAGQQVADGTPPYVGILNRAGPLAHIIPGLGALGARAVGVDDLFGIRVLFMLISVGAVCLTYLLARDLYASKLAGLLGAASLLSFSGFITFATNGPREKTAMVFFLLCALWAIVGRRWFAAGFALSLSVLVWQPVFVVGVATAAVAVLALPLRELLRAAVRFVLGGSVPLAVMVVYFAAVGALNEFVQAFFLIPRQYQNPNAFAEHSHVAMASLRAGFGLSLWLVPIGLVTLGVLAIAGVAQRKWRDRLHISVAALFAGGLVGLAWTSYDFERWPDLFVLLPYAAVGVGGIVMLFVMRIPPRAALALTLVAVAAGVTYAGQRSLGRDDHRLVKQQASVDAALAQLPPGASILSIEAPQSLVLSGKTNPTRLQTFSSGLNHYVEDHYPGGLRGYGDFVAREKPTLVAIGIKHGVPSWLQPTITSDYEKVGKAPDWTWYALRSLGPDVLAALRSHV
jgi:hypothetical protein